MEAVINSILSPQFVFTMIRVATPLLFAAMAALVTRKAGVMCIALEGIMLFSALGGVIGSSFLRNEWMGVLVGIGFGLVIMGIFAYFVLILRANPILTGLALNILGSGGTVFLLFLISGDKGSSTGLNSLTMPVIQLPIIKDIPILGEMFSGHNILSYIAILACVLVYFFINRSATGLRIRSVGENPKAAESVGISVQKTQIIALIVAGILTSLGGVYMSMGYLPFFTRDMVAGRGFMAIAAQNLGGGSVIPTVIAAFFFGFANALSNIMQSLNLPSELMQSIPYIATLIGLLFTGREIKRTTKTEYDNDGKKEKA